MRYIKLSEKILNWEWFTDGNMLKVWIYLLVNAQQFEDGRYRGVELRTGQVITGRKEISRETGLSEQQVRTCLNKLKSTNEITIETTNQYSLITILKYDKYQSKEAYNNQENNQEDNQQITNEQPTDNQQITTSKILRNEDIKNIKNKSINADGKKFVKPTLEEIVSYCIANGYSTVEPQKFYDYYEKHDWTVKEKNGARRKMKNWKLCLNSWVVNEIRFNETNDLKNRAREAYIKDVERKQRYEETKGSDWFE